MDRGTWQATVHGVTEWDPTEVTEHARTHSEAQIYYNLFNHSLFVGHLGCHQFSRSPIILQIWEEGRKKARVKSKKRINPPHYII